MKLPRLAAALTIAVPAAPAGAAYSDLVALNAAASSGEPLVLALLAIGLVVVSVVLLPLAWWPPASVRLSSARLAAGGCDGQEAAGMGTGARR